MRRVKRFACLLLAVLLAALSVPPAAGAADSVCFTAVNDTLLPLADETMPFVAGGMLYVSSMAFDGTDLGVYYSRSIDKTTVVLYKRRSVIVFDLSAGTVETNNGQAYAGSAVTRGDAVFLPADTVCRFFELEYSFSRVSYGYLLRIRSDTAVLSDAKFIDAANTVMSSRYARYERKQTEPEDPAEPTVEPPPADGPVQQETNRRTVCFIWECTDPSKSELLLSCFEYGQAACLFLPDNLTDADGLLRRLASGQGAAALRVDASDGAESAIAQIEAGNRAIWAAANWKTRLVWLDGATEATARAVAAAGYCPISAALYLNGSVSRMRARILAAADAGGGGCRVFLGTDAEAAGNLSALLIGLRSDNCIPARLNEVTVSGKELAYGTHYSGR